MGQDISTNKPPIEIRTRRQHIANHYWADGYGRGKNKRKVYLIDGFAYAYHPRYARQAFTPLKGEFENYIPVNLTTYLDSIYFYQCEPTDHRPLIDALDPELPR